MQQLFQTLTSFRTAINAFNQTHLGQADPITSKNNDLLLFTPSLGNDQYNRLQGSGMQQLFQTLTNFRTAINAFNQTTLGQADPITLKNNDLLLFTSSLSNDQYNRLQGSGMQQLFQTLTNFRTAINAFNHFSFNDTAPTEIYTISLHHALPIFGNDQYNRLQGSGMQQLFQTLTNFRTAINAFNQTTLGQADPITL